MTDDCMGCREPGYSHAAYCPESRVEDLRKRLAEAERKLQLIAAHTGHNKFLADRELLSDLLIRIQRICNDKPADSASHRESESA